MINDTRTVNVARNMLFAVTFQVVNLLFKFIGRTVFIRYLGVDYLGVNGLFTNVLSILSFTELGIGNAIIFHMYKPLAEKDYEKTKSLMALYSKAYKIIGSVVAIAGLAIIPFIDLIIKEKPNINDDILIIYLLFLFNTVISYFYVYKKSLIIADQKNYVVLIYQNIFYIIQIIAQIIILLTTKNYILYLVAQIVCTFLNNVLNSHKADKMYPYLKNGRSKSLTKLEISKIFTDVKALSIYRFGTGISNGIDNIIISSILGITAVGLVSNYVLIISAIKSITVPLMGSFTASLGNLNAIESTEKKESTFGKVFFISAWLYGFCAVGLLLFINPFIEIWIGKTYLLEEIVVLSLALNFYVSNIHFTAYTYLTTMGLFSKGKVGPFIEASLNIILSIVLGRYLGLAGIFFATSIASLLSIGLIDPILVYRIGLKQNPIKYYVNYFIFIVIFTLLSFSIKSTIYLISIEGILGFTLKLLIMVIEFNVLMFLIFHRTKVFKEISKYIVKLTKGLIKSR